MDNIKSKIYIIAIFFLSHFMSPFPSHLIRINQNLHNSATKSAITIK